MAKSSVYIETSVIGYLTMRSSRDIVIESHRQTTRTWWDTRRVEFDLFISHIVVDEITKGDPSAVADRLAAVAGIPLLDVNDAVASLAANLIHEHALPAKAIQDAFHIATAAYHGVDILLTWNCTHIANPHILQLVRKFFSASNMSLPEVTTPDALAGEEDDI